MADLVARLAPLLVLGCGASGSGGFEEPSVPLTEPTAVCVGSERRACRSVTAIEELLGSTELQILQATDTPGGTQGAKVLTLTEPARDTTLRAKWRSFHSGDLINDPRKEVAAYAVQRLFLEPRDYVVPPTRVHCFALPAYRVAVDEAAEPSFRSTGSICGILAYWLPNAMDVAGARERGVISGDSLLDDELLSKDSGYRQAVTDLNVLTYLVRHGDAHEHQFLLTQHARGVHPYSVDNSIAFESLKNPMLLFREDWSMLHVDALSERTVKRLRDVRLSDLGDLAILEQFELGGGAYRPAARTHVVGDPADGTRVEGRTLQVGLGDGEIEGLTKRIADLLARVETGELGTF